MYLTVLASGVLKGDLILIGPPNVPFFGGYFFMLLLNRHHLHKAANKLCEFYKSNIIGIHLGPFPLVILNDNEKVRKALYTREMDGRPGVLMARMRDPKMNITGDNRVKVLSVPKICD